MTISRGFPARNLSNIVAAAGRRPGLVVDEAPDVAEDLLREPRPEHERLRGPLPRQRREGPGLARPLVVLDVAPVRVRGLPERLAAEPRDDVRRRRAAERGDAQRLGREAAPRGRARRAARGRRPHVADERAQVRRVRAAEAAAALERDPERRAAEGEPRRLELAEQRQQAHVVAGPERRRRARAVRFAARARLGRDRAEAARAREHAPPLEPAHERLEEPRVLGLGDLDGREEAAPEPRADLRRAPGGQRPEAHGRDGRAGEHPPRLARRALGGSLGLPRRAPAPSRLRRPALPPRRWPRRSNAAGPPPACRRTHIAGREQREDGCHAEPRRRFGNRKVHVRLRSATSPAKLDASTPVVSCRRR